MDWFRYDRNLRHERVNFSSLSAELLMLLFYIVNAVSNHQITCSVKNTLKEVINVVFYDPLHKKNEVYYLGFLQ